MNDTDTLRTQYVDDIMKQRQIMEDAMLYQNSSVEVGEGFSTMVPKVQALTGSKPSLPFISFYRCKLSTLPNLNFNTMQGRLAKVFAKAASYGTSSNPLDLKNINFKNEINFDYMFNPYTVASNSYISFGELFDMSNAESMRSTFYNSRISLSNIDKIPTVNAYKLKDLTAFAYDTPQAFEILKKLYNVPVEHLDKLVFTSNTSYSSTIRETLQHIIYNWDLTHLKSISYFLQWITLTDELIDLFKLLVTPNIGNIEDINSLFYNASGRNLTNGVLDLSDLVFTSPVLDASSLFRSTQNFEKIIAPTINSSGFTSLYYMFYSTYNVKGIDLSRINLGYVTDTRSLVTSSASSVIDFAFGYDLGKGFTRKTNNYSYYTLSLSYLTNITKDMIVDVFDKLYNLNLTYNVDGGGRLYTQKIIIPSTIKSVLTPEEIALATAKGWTVA